MSEANVLPIENQLVLRTASLIMAGLALAGCTSAESNSPSTAPQTITASTPESATPESSSAAPSASEIPSATPTMTFSESDGDCLKPNVPVFPASKLEFNNTADLQDQLDALQNAKSPDQPVTFGVMKNAGAIVFNSLTDNVYAIAMSRAAQLPADQIPSATEVVNGTYNVGAGDCMTTAQLKQIELIYSTLVDGLGPKVTDEVSANIQGTYKILLREYNSFTLRWQEELAS